MEKAPDAFRTISEVADELDVPQHVLRFWETRFAQIKPMKRGGGRRYYRPDDVDLLRGIRHLLYSEGYTIRGVQRLLKDNGARYVQSILRPKEAEVAAFPPEGVDGAGAASAEPIHADNLVSPADGAQQSGEAEERGADPEHLDAKPLPAQQSERPAPLRPIPRANLVAAPREPRPEPGPVGNASGREPVGAAGRDSRRDGAASPDLPPRMPAEALQSLQGALAELAECRRVLDAALRDDG